MGFVPRIALESSDSSQNRLKKISRLIRESKYSIHDLSRSQAKSVGEYYRLNMPFELGIDYGCKEYSGHPYSDKRLLVLEERKFRYQAALSDLSGCDIHVHEGDFQKAIKAVRAWLVSEARAKKIAPTVILNGYSDFQEWHYERQLSEGYSEEDIQEYPTLELLHSMQDWLAAGRPSTF
jgi:hypothetical protein